MNVFTLALVCASSLFATHASAQWQWVDDQGRKVFSDRAPPNQIPPERILRQPAWHPAKGTAAPAPASPSAAADGPAAASGSAPAPTPARNANAETGIDQELQARKTAAQAQQAERAQAEAQAQEKKQAHLRQDNCTRAQAMLATLAQAQQLMHTNAKGERAFMDDATRSAERQRAQAIAAQNCGPAPRPQSTQ